MDYLERNVLEIIEKFSYDFYVINLDKSIVCTCISPSSSRADVSCPKCIGTGYKIRIKKVRGASQDSNIPSTIRSTDFIVSKNYYIPYKYKLSDDDIIVDGDQVFNIFRRQLNRTFNGKIVYTKCLCVDKKFDQKIFLENFKKALRGE